MRRVSYANVCMFVAILACGASQIALAQSGVISIKEGTLIFENGDGVLDISGNHRFTFHAGVHISGGVFNAYSQCQTGCEPGTVVQLNARWVGNDLLGTARLRGKTYENVGGGNSDSSADVGFTGSVTMPPMSSEPVMITVPFDFSGFFSYGLNGSDPQQDLMAGGGRVTLTLRPNVDGNAWEIPRAEFVFIPVEQR